MMRKLLIPVAVLVGVLSLAGCTSDEERYASRMLEWFESGETIWYGSANGLPSTSTREERDASRGDLYEILLARPDFSTFRSNPIQIAHYGLMTTYSFYSDALELRDSLEADFSSFGFEADFMTIADRCVRAGHDYGLEGMRMEEVSVVEQKYPSPSDTRSCRLILPDRGTLDSLEFIWNARDRVTATNRQWEMYLSRFDE